MAATATIDSSSTFVIDQKKIIGNQRLLVPVTGARRSVIAGLDDGNGCIHRPVSMFAVVEAGVTFR